MHQPTDCLIGLGANLGDREAQLHAAVDLITRHSAVESVVVSRWHATLPVGGPSGQGEFLNGAARLTTALSPAELFLLLKSIERHLGRRPGRRWGPRLMDLDLLLFGQEIIDQNVPGDDFSTARRLQVPHPRMAFRRFVLVPAAEVAADMRHPHIGWTVGELLNHAQTHVPLVVVSSACRQRETALADGLADATGAEIIRRRDADEFFPDVDLAAEQPKRRALEFIYAYGDRLPAPADWPQERLIVSEFDPAEILKMASAAVRDQIQTYFDRHIPRPKLWIVEAVGAAPSFAGPQVNVTGMAVDAALREAIAAVRSMQA